MTMTGEPTIEELRAQRDALDLRVAQATIGPAEEFMALLASAEIVQFLDRLTSAVSSLDDQTRRRVEQWVKARDAMAKLGEVELTRLRKLVDAAES